jgi:hypothetical protein
MAGTWSNSYSLPPGVSYSLDAVPFVEIRTLRKSLAQLITKMNTFSNTTNDFRSKIKGQLTQLLESSEASSPNALGLADVIQEMNALDEYERENNDDFEDELEYAVTRLGAFRLATNHGNMAHAQQLYNLTTNYTPSNTSVTPTEVVVDEQVETSDGPTFSFADGFVLPSVGNDNQQVSEIVHQSSECGMWKQEEYQPGNR